MLYLNDRAREDPAVRWPDEPIARFWQGHIAFGPDPYPTLDEVRVTLPEYVGLWDAIVTDWRAMLMEVATTGPVARQHADFFDMPLLLTDEERRVRLVDH